MSVNKTCMDVLWRGALYLEIVGKSVFNLDIFLEGGEDEHNEHLYSK